MSNLSAVVIMPIGLHKEAHWLTHSESNDDFYMIGEMEQAL